MPQDGGSNVGSALVLRAQVIERAPHCESPGCTGRGKALKPWGQRESTLADLPRVLRTEGAPKEYPVRVVLQSQRYRCSLCSKLFSHIPAKVKAPHSNMTARLWDWIAQESLNHPIAAIAERAGLEEKQVRRALDAYVQALAETTHIRTPVCMALVNLVALRRQRLAVINSKDRCIVDLLPTPGLDSLNRYLSGLRDPQAVEVVSIGMLGNEGPATVDALRKAFPKALVMIDRPHVMATVRSIARLVEQDASFGGGEAIARVHAELMRLYGSDADVEAASACFHEIFAGLTQRQRKTFALLAIAWENQRDELLAFFTAEGRAASMQPVYDGLGDLDALTTAIDGLTSRGNFDILRRALLYPSRLPAHSGISPGTGIQRLVGGSRLEGERAAYATELNEQMLQVLRQRMRDEGQEPPDPSMRGITRARRWAGWSLQLPPALGGRSSYFSSKLYGGLEMALLQAQIERDRRMFHVLTAPSAPSDIAG